MNFCFLLMKWESKWVINFEDSVYLIISAGLLCLIIIWMLSVLLVSKQRYDFRLFNTPSNSSISESLSPEGIENRSPPIVPQQGTQSLNIHPLKVMRIYSKPNSTPPSSQSSCADGDCK